MKIKHQLLLVSLLLLSLPWAGYLFIQEISLALRHGQTSALTATTHAIAHSISGDSALQQLQTRLNSDIPAIYAVPETYPQVIDGFYDYENVQLRNFKNTESDTLQIRYQLSHDKDNYYLLLVVEDKHINYVANTPSNIQGGDAFILLMDQKNTNDNSIISYHFKTRAPGAVYGQYREGKEWKQNTALFGFWQETQQGYNLEIQLSKTVVGNKLSFYLKKQNDKRYFSVDGPVSKSDLNARWLVAQDDELNKKLTPYQRPSLELAIIDKHHWVLAHLKEQQAEQQNYAEIPQTFWLLEMFYRYLLSRGSDETLQPQQLQGSYHSKEIEKAFLGKTSHHWYQVNDRSNLSILSVAAPLKNQQGDIVAALLAHETTNQVQNLTNSAFNRLFLLSFLTLGGAVFALLAYSSVLAFRIQRLSKATAEMFAEDGTITTSFPRSKARDEIGELSRNFTVLAWRLKEYTEYLQTLSRKLSHELRTPLAIVHSSLDNLNTPGDQQLTEQQQRIYQQRAKEGANRLSRIITAMSEATRVEESIQQHDFAVFNLQQMLTELSAAYQDSYSEHRISFISDSSNCEILGSPDLIVQMLDKLIDNASDFCPKNGNIEIKLQQLDEKAVLTIANDGPLLPETMKSQLFDSMVSIRASNKEKNKSPGSHIKSTTQNRPVQARSDTHLGLGLFIVKLIVDAHGGKIRADNREDLSGVYFTISLPCSGQASNNRSSS